MATADQLKALLRSHAQGDEQRFYSVAMQVAAHEARLGHGKLAQELRDLIDEAKRKRSITQPVPISRPRGELGNLLAVTYPKQRLIDMVLAPALKGQMERIIREQRHAKHILAHGLSPRRKMLLVGPPGTGKTLTASVLAGELGIPLFEVRLDGLLTKYMGETAAKLRQVFDATGNMRGVYLFDEFDAIGAQRGSDNDVGEIRRVLNSFLLMIEQDASNSLILASTNHVEMLDQALFRRFDDVLQYELPGPKGAEELLVARLLPYADGTVDWAQLVGDTHGLSHADIARAADEVLKAALMDGRKEISQQDIHEALVERQTIARSLALID